MRFGFDSVTILEINFDFNFHLNLYFDIDLNFGNHIVNDHDSGIHFYLE